MNTQYSNASYSAAVSNVFYLFLNSLKSPVLITMPTPIMTSAMYMISLLENFCFDRNINASGVANMYEIPDTI